LGSSALLPAGLGFRNKVMNGGMVIDQRNSGSAINPVTAGYNIDRWTYYQSQTGKFSFQQNQGSVTPPTGFVKYAGFTSLSAYSITATDQFLYSHLIEGNNVADLAWGTANAKPVVVSFWVRSSLTGTFGGVIQNSAQNRVFPFSYAISSANTWEYKTVYVSGDTTGTWLTDTGVGLRLIFSLGTGSTYSAAAGTWTSTQFVSSVTGAVSVAGTNGATWQITGVQLEQNYQPTPFEQRPIGIELALCQRYYWRSKANSVYGQVATGSFTSTTNAAIVVQPSVPLRTGPNTSGVEYSNMAAGNNYNAPYAITAVAINHSSTTAWGFDCTITGATQHTPAFLQANNNSAGYIAVSVEL
jgi:hypothetical protein